MEVWVIIAVFIILTVIILYTVYQGVNVVICKGISTTMAKLHSVSNDRYLNLPLGDYYIKSAYNCCAVNNYKYDYVDVCGLKACLKRGVRFLDFEIFSVKNDPVVALSSLDNNYLIETYNYLHLSEIFTELNNLAFSVQSCPNPKDPLIINLRIMSNNKEMYNTIADLLYKHLESYLLGKEYSYEMKKKCNTGMCYFNISEIILEKLMGKVIIFIVDKHQLVRETKLAEFSNLISSSGNPFYSVLSANEIIHSQNNLIEHNKLNLTLATPNKSDIPKNMDSDLIEKDSGTQFVAMCFQKKDNLLTNYEKKFEEAVDINKQAVPYAFRLKPQNQRHIPTYFDTTKLVCDPSMSDQKTSYQLAGQKKLFTI